MGKDAAGFIHVKKIAKYNFKEDVKAGIDWGERNLFVDEPGKLPGKIKILREFKRLDGATTLVAYEKRFDDEKKPK